MSKNKSIFPVCLNEKHWNIFDQNCTKCQNELKNSGLLTTDEYSSWLAGEFTLGFKI